MVRSQGKERKVTDKRKNEFAPPAGSRAGVLSRPARPRKIKFYHKKGSIQKWHAETLI